MAIFESGYGPLLQGVSQQVPRERLPGQVQAQLNMLSDPTTGLRRRPGAKVIVAYGWPDVTPDSVRAWYTDIAGKRVHVYLNVATGNIFLLDDAYTQIASLNGGQYCITSDASNIRATTVGDEFFILNTEKIPVKGAGVGGTPTNARGFFYIVAGAFNKEYQVTVKTASGEVTATYTTPSGSAPGDAALATPAYIAEQLRAGVASTLGLQGTVRHLSYVYLDTTGPGAPLRISSDSGTAFIVTSRDQYAGEVGQLPAVLPNEANGMIMRVGDVRSPVYYTYHSVDQVWLESGDQASPLTLTNMPIAITHNGASWVISPGTFEGRFAGDDDSNPDPRFVSQGISGISAYQGRLVLLSGSLVSLAAAGRPRRFYRSTITSIVDSDPIEIGSSANSSAGYEYAVPFMKDLVLFSAAYQAIIPSTGQAITPRNATVVPTSTHAADMSAPPVPVGRTLMYPIPRSQDFFGLFEMVPNPFADSQYVSADSTAHVPRLMGGRCRFGASSGVAGIAVFGPSGDKRSLLVHEYFWSGDTKEQQAWHVWTFPYDIAYAYFAQQVIHLAFVKNGAIVICSIDPRVGTVDEEELRRPYLDLYWPATITDNVAQPSTWLTFVAPEDLGKVSMALSTGPLAGEEVGFVFEDGVYNTVPSHPSGTVQVGFKYRSSVVPTVPQVRDREGAVVSTNKLTVLRYIVDTVNSQEYSVAVTDRHAPATPQSVGTLYWSSAELELGQARVAGESKAIIPARTNASSTVCELYTEGVGEFNVVGVDFVAKSNQKIRRV